MLGFKIIKEKELDLLYRRLNQAEETNRESSCKIQKLESDCRSLRSQNTRCRNQINDLKFEAEDLRQFKNDVVEALVKIDLGNCRLFVCNSCCDTCEREQDNCVKYHFGKHDFCVINQK